MERNKNQKSDARVKNADLVRGRSEWLDLLHRCQNGEITCIFVLKEIEAEIERENAKMRYWIKDAAPLLLMKTIQVRIGYYAGTQSDWVYPVGEHSTALFKFVTSGTVGVPADAWSTEVEPVLKALGWWWSLSVSA